MSSKPTNGRQDDDGLPPPLKAAEQRLESIDPSWVDFLRNVRGPEPIESMPLAFRVFFYVAILGPLVFVVFVEWTWRQILPLWISLPLTMTAVVLTLLRKRRARRRSGGDARGE